MLMDCGSLLSFFFVPGRLPQLLFSHWKTSHVESSVYGMQISEVLSFDIHTNCPGYRGGTFITCPLAGVWAYSVARRKNGGNKNYSQPQRVYPRRRRLRDCRSGRQTLWPGWANYAQPLPLRSFREQAVLRRLSQDLRIR